MSKALYSNVERRIKPNNHTIYSHYAFRELGEKRVSHSIAVYNTAEVFEISVKEVLDAIQRCEAISYYGQIH